MQLPSKAILRDLPMMARRGRRVAEPARYLVAHRLIADSAGNATADAQPEGRRGILLV